MKSFEFVDIFNVLSIFSLSKTQHRKRRFWAPLLPSSVGWPIVNLNALVSCSCIARALLFFIYLFEGDSYFIIILTFFFTYLLTYFDSFYYDCHSSTSITQSRIDKYWPKGPFGRVLFPHHHSLYSLSLSVSFTLNRRLNTFPVVDPYRLGGRKWMVEKGYQKARNSSLT